jgi:uncharacterized protein YdeI (YjbR/CyaY-like superfamily)
MGTTEINQPTNLEKKMRDWKLHNIYSSPYIIRMIKSRRIRWGGSCSTHGNEEVCIYFSWENRKKKTERPRRTWEDNVKIDLRNTGLVMWTGII